MEAKQLLGAELKKKLEAMHRDKVKQVIRRKASRRQTKAWLSNLSAMMPALFLCLLTWSTCLVEDPMLKADWLYKDVLRFSTLPLDARNNELLQALQGVYERDGEAGHFGKLKVNGWPTCDTCYQRCFGVSESTWKRRQRDVKEGKKHWEHGNVGHEGRYTNAGNLSRAWMSSFFCSLGDFQPDTGEIHLPPMDQLDIYKEMRCDLGDAAVSKPWFYQIWADEFPEVRIPPEQRLGKCKQCASLHEQILDTKDPVERKLLKERRMEHIRFVRKERLVYHRWRQTCRQQPDKYVLIILDGMDQSKTNLPFFNCGDQPQQLVARIVGAIVHSATKKIYTYAVTHYTKETNTMVEVLGRVLADQDHLPPELIIQLDNTSTDNKNVKLFSYLASLVETGQVERVTVNFLPVGHTHEDIDQLFSRISKELQRVSCRSMPELFASIERCLTGVTCCWVHKVVDFWKAISPRQIPYQLSKWYSFQLSKRPKDERVVIRYKVNMSDAIWLPHGLDATDLTYASDALLACTGVPDLEFVVPNVLPVAQLRDSMVQFESRLARLRSPTHFPNEEDGAAFKWWMEFLDKEDARLSAMCSSCKSIRKELGTIVIHQKKGARPVETEVNKYKRSRRKVLSEELESHDCSDRKAGNHVVPDNHNTVLLRMMQYWEATCRQQLPVITPDPSVSSSSSSNSSSSQRVHDSSSSDDSDSDIGFTETTDGMPLLKSGQSAGVAYQRRGQLIEKKMIVATLPSPDDAGTPMGEHPFLIAKVVKVTKRHFHLHYWGEEFLGVYRPLKTDTGADYICKYKIGAISILHWNIKLVGGYKGEAGRVSEADLRVLSLDYRVLWRRDKRNMRSVSSSSQSSGPKRKKHR